MGSIVFVIERLASMPFEFECDLGLTAPAAEGLGEGGEQEVVDLGVVGSRC